MLRPPDVLARDSQEHPCAGCPDHEMIKDNQPRGLGCVEAMNEALLSAQQDIAYTNAVAEDASREHAVHPDGDDGFDKDFMRSDP